MESHKDLLGREVKEEDYVAFSHKNYLMVGKVIKITPKQVRVKSFERGCSYKKDFTYLKYTNQCVLVGGPELVAHILKEY